MKQHKVVIVHLRRPRDKEDPRHDPFWEFGSFGITGCHCDNLLHPDTAHELKGVRFAFAQGGRSGTRLVFLSPPIKAVVPCGKKVEVLWSPQKMPFQYDRAPLLIDKKRQTDFPLLKTLLKSGKRPTLVAQFASNFRARKLPLRDDVGLEIVRTYEKARRAASSDGIAANYVDALPVERKPLSHDEQRQAYEDQAGDLNKGRSSCPRRRRGRVC
jgi:hypothetical protein